MQGFDWDKGNEEKNWIKHKVSKKEAESVFFDKNIVFLNDLGHSKTEARFYALGISKNKKHMTIIFTLREEKIRVISARVMSKKERREWYEK